ncbi:Uncharacterised protein [Corynebacterium renale]|uniref:hypothetical protein n=1 Tax=Corynebacterium renale TaxID=1724 RepID=UPI000DA2D484|nr:hypothetical protein [Corynebacterium renale]SQG64984.1 Uncharacterised protein [Corynebacterium renale]STC96975.1 Uncharacterised protein [Corynebacterium renale]
MTNLPTKAAIAAFCIAVSAAFSPQVHADEFGGENTTVREAIASAPSQNTGNHASRSANGGSWAPGGVGAFNWLYVNGRGLNVTTASVAYVPGTSLATSNVCVDEFEIAYYEHGQRITETGGNNCAVGRVTHTFTLYKNLDAHTPFCGRVRIGATWGNYACINILP